MGDDGRGEHAAAGVREHDRAQRRGGASLSIEGASVTDGVPTPSDVVVPPAANELCITPFAPGSLTGKIVVCRRGTNGRINKGLNALQGGAAGMILYNQSAAVTDLETDNHFLPTSHIQFADGTALVAFLAANTNVKATLTAGESVRDRGDVMASFSSRGGPGLHARRQQAGRHRPGSPDPGRPHAALGRPGHGPPGRAVPGDRRDVDVEPPRRGRGRAA